MTYTDQLALNIYHGASLYAFDYAAAIINVVSREPWSWRIRQQVADTVLLKVLELLKRGEIFTIYQGR